MIIDSGDYKFESEEMVQRFINKVLSEAERLFLEEGYHRKYVCFESFLNTNEIGGVAHHVFEGEYGK